MNTPTSVELVLTICVHVLFHSAVSPSLIWTRKPFVPKILHKNLNIILIHYAKIWATHKQGQQQTHFEQEYEINVLFNCTFLETNALHINDK